MLVTSLVTRLVMLWCSVQARACGFGGSSAGGIFLRTDWPKLETVRMDDF